MHLRCERQRNSWIRLMREQGKQESKECHTKPELGEDTTSLDKQLESNLGLTSTLPASDVPSIIFPCIQDALLWLSCGRDPSLKGELLTPPAFPPPQRLQEATHIEVSVVCLNIVISFCFMFFPWLWCSSLTLLTIYICIAQTIMLEICKYSDLYTSTGIRGGAPLQNINILLTNMALLRFWWLAPCTWWVECWAWLTLNCGVPPTCAVLAASFPHSLTWCWATTTNSPPQEHLDLYNDSWWMLLQLHHHHSKHLFLIISNNRCSKAISVMHTSICYSYLVWSETSKLSFLLM